MLDVIRNRRSVRKYETRAIEEEKLQEILEAARLAPSGNNTQPWHFVLVRSEDMRRKLAAASHEQMWMADAPVHIVCVGDIRVRVGTDVRVDLTETNPMPEFKKLIRDTSIAIEHLVLEAENQGLSTCWIAWFDPREIAAMLGIPDDKYVQAIIPVGYGAEAPKPRPRKPMSAIIHEERW